MILVLRKLKNIRAEQNFSTGKVVVAHTNMHEIMDGWMIIRGLRESKNIKLLVL